MGNKLLLLPGDGCNYSYRQWDDIISSTKIKCEATVASAATNNSK